MCKRSLGLGLLAALVGGLGGGCKKSAPTPLLLPQAPPPPVETVASIHWLGKQRLAADTNAASLMAIWNLPESKALEAQTLDRLAMGLLATNPVPSLKSKVQSPEAQPPAEGNPKAEARSPKEGQMPKDKALQHPASGSKNPESSIQHPASSIPPPLQTQHSTLNTQHSTIPGPAALLRPLLEDLLEQESFLRVRQATNQPGELALAIKLSEERARLWQTNLATLLESLTSNRVTAAPGRTNGWQLSVHSPQSTVRSPQSAVAGPPPTRTVDLARVGDWTLVGLAPGSNALLGEALTLFRENPTGEDLAPPNTWLFANLELRRIASALSLRWDLPAELPWLTLGVTGDGKTVHTRAQLNFAQPLPFELEPWNIPTNLIHDPLVSFTAIQGLQPWLSSSKLWQRLDLGTPPNQLYFWAQGGLEFLSYFTAPTPNASNCVERVTNRLLQKPDAYLAAEGMGRLGRSTNGAGVVWSGVFLMEPFIQPVGLTGGNFVFGGLLASPLTNRPPPAELFQALLGVKNLVAYDWELTGPRLHQWLNFGQLVRFAFHVAQVPPKSASLEWLRALEPELGNCVTAVKRTGPAQLSFTRNSALGLTAAELDLLADWLESPRFPRGLNTFLGEPVPLPRPQPPSLAAHVRTNSPTPIRRY